MKKRIFNAVMLASSAVLALSFVIILSVLYGYFSKLRIEQLKAELDIAAYGAETGGEDWLKGLQAADYRLTLVNYDGRVLYDSETDAAAMENHAGREEIREALLTGKGDAERMSSTLTQKTFYQAVKLSDGSVLRMSITQGSVLSLLFGMLTLLLIVLFAAVLISEILASRLSKRIVKPLACLDLEHPLENDAYEELSPLLSRIARQRKEIDLQLAALKRRQDEFAAITGSMGEGLVLLNEKGDVISINPAAQKLFYTDAFCVGKDFLTVERSRDIQRAVDAALSGGRGETELLRDGRQYRLSASRVLSGGRTVGAALLSFDVTDRAEAERQRREFTANVSHELKTPLQSIMGSAELIQNGLVKPEDMPRFTGRIRSEAERLVTLIDDIIRLSQLDEGGELPFESVDVYGIAKDAAAQLAGAAAAKGVKLDVFGQSASISGVRRLISDIAYNLIDNAIKYNREGGSVKISVSEDENGVALTVKDTGIGIPEQDINRVFERFYRVDKSHSRATGGTGLGLSIVKHAAELNHGKITLESAEGKGSRIEVAFPNERRA